MTEPTPGTAIAGLRKRPQKGCHHCRKEHEMNAPARYRKKPVVIEAMLFDGTTAEMHAVYQWVEANTQGSFEPYDGPVPASGVSIDPATGFMLIATLGGVMQAKPGDYIIRGVQGEFYPCKPDIFRATYEVALTPERIDHVAEALAHMPDPMMPGAVAAALIAQTHATLALVEQQRIANLIALAESRRIPVNGARAALTALYSGDPEVDGSSAMRLNPDIAAALGLKP